MLGAGFGRGSAGFCPIFDLKIATSGVSNRFSTTSASASSSTSRDDVDFLGKRALGFFPNAAPSIACVLANILEIFTMGGFTAFGGGGLSLSSPKIPNKVLRFA